MREQAGALTPPSFDENRLRQAKKGGVMGTVFTGKNSRAYKAPEVNLELSLEMNKKMQSVLEDTLLKNITLKVIITFKVYHMPICIVTYYLRRISIRWGRRYREYQLNYKLTRKLEDSYVIFCL